VGVPKQLQKRTVVFHVPDIWLRAVVESASTVRCKCGHVLVTSVRPSVRMTEVTRCLGKKYQHCHAGTPVIQNRSIWNVIVALKRAPSSSVQYIEAYSSGGVWLWCGCRSVECVCFHHWCSPHSAWNSLRPADIRQQRHCTELEECLLTLPPRLFCHLCDTEILSASFFLPSREFKFIIVLTLWNILLPFSGSTLKIVPPQ
jgi:hypothetical protein